MSNDIYFCGWRPEHFKNWSGQGSIDIVGFGTADANGVPGMNLMAADETNPIHGGCAWGDFKDPATGAPTALNDFWFCFQFFSSSFSQSWNAIYNANAGNAAYAGDWRVNDATYYPYATFVLHASNGKIIAMKPTIGSAGFDLYAGDVENIVDNTKLTRLTNTTFTNTYGPQATPTFTYNRHSFQVSGAGTQNGMINWYVDGTLLNNWSGDLTDYVDFSAISFHRDMGAFQSWSWPGHPSSLLYYAFVCNFKTLRTYLDMRMASGLSSSSTWNNGTLDGATTQSTTNNLGGIYSTEADEVAIFSFSKQFTPKSIFYPKVVQTSALVSSFQTPYGTALDTVVQDSDGDTKSIGEIEIGDDGVYKWSSTSNPNNSKDWTTDDLNGSSFNIVRRNG